MRYEIPSNFTVRCVHPCRQPTSAIGNDSKGIAGIFYECRRQSALAGSLDKPRRAARSFHRKWKKHQNLPIARERFAYMLSRCLYDLDKSYRRLDQRLLRREDIIEDY